MNDQEQVLYDSDKAAKFMTGLLSGWVDRQGRFWGDDEHMARTSGCTHKPCDKCGAIIDVRRYCRDCYEKSRIEKYNAKTKKQWDGETPLYSDSADEYFFDEDYIRDYMHEHDCSIESMRLVICEPNYFSEVESDHFYDVLPEGIGELPSELEDALREINSVINKLPPASWSPGKYAAECDL